MLQVEAINTDIERKRITLKITNDHTHGKLLLATYKATTTHNMYGNMVCTNGFDLP